MANKHFKLFESADVTSSPNSKQKISSNYAIAIQLVWTGLSGTATFDCGVSMDGVNFDDFPFLDKDGNRVTEIPISGANGSATIEIDSIISIWANFNVDGSLATAGTITAEYIQIDNQDIY